MKFYKEGECSDYYSDKILINKLIAIYSKKNSYVNFYKNGKYHNSKNASFIGYNYCKQFCLNDKYFGHQYTFSKQSWRKFVRTFKLQAFL